VPVGLTRWRKIEDNASRRLGQVLAKRAKGRIPGMKAKGQEFGGTMLEGSPEFTVGVRRPPTLHKVVAERPGQAFPAIDNKVLDSRIVALEKGDEGFSSILANDGASENNG